MLACVNIFQHIQAQLKHSIRPSLSSNWLYGWLRIVPARPYPRTLMLRPVLVPIIKYVLPLMGAVVLLGAI